LTKEVLDVGGNLRNSLEKEVAMAPTLFRIPPYRDNGLGISSIDFEPLLNSHQAARLLCVHPKTLQRMARRGEIQAIQMGKLWRFRASDLNDWIYRRRAS
jgi:excisionase family DNA binding protein